MLLYKLRDLIEFGELYDSQFISKSNNSMSTNFTKSNIISRQRHYNDFQKQVKEFENRLKEHFGDKPHTTMYRHRLYTSNAEQKIFDNMTKKFMILQSAIQINNKKYKNNP